MNDLQKENTELQQVLGEEMNKLRHELDAANNKIEHLEYADEQNQEFQNKLLEMITEMKEKKNGRMKNNEEQVSAIKVCLPILKLFIVFHVFWIILFILYLSK